MTSTTVLLEFYCMLIAMVQRMVGVAWRQHWLWLVVGLTAVPLATSMQVAVSVTPWCNHSIRVRMNPGQLTPSGLFPPRPLARHWRRLYRYGPVEVPLRPLSHFSWGFFSPSPRQRNHASTFLIVLEVDSSQACMRFPCSFSQELLIWAASHRSAFDGVQYSLELRLHTPLGKVVHRLSSGCLLSVTIGCSVLRTSALTPNRPRGTLPAPCHSLVPPR